MPDTPPTFQDLGLSADALAAIAKKGFEEPSPIQQLVIPKLLRNSTDIIAQAQTGTGKTAAFGLPLIEMLNPREFSVQALVLTPTRELAIQVSDEIRSLRSDSRLQVIPVYGGQSFNQQLRSLKKGAHIVVGTPGRVIDHLHRRTLRLEDIEFLVLDEADEMLNMGFIEDMEEIIKHTNPDKRTLLFSATMPPRIKELAKKYLKEQEFITVKQQPLTPRQTEHIYYEVKNAEKFEALCRIIDIEDEFYGLVFCRTKSDVDTVVSQLIERGYDADAIHGDISQDQRERTLMKFRQRRINVLVATDVAARGLDVVDLTHVINYALPQDPESYVHRSGRTGRAGKQGTSITFITPREYQKLLFIQRISKTAIKKSIVPDVKDIIKAKKKKIADEVMEINAQEIGETYHNWAKKLLEHGSESDMLARILYHAYHAELDPDMYDELHTERHSRGQDLEGQARLFVALGKKDSITPPKLVKFIIQNTGVPNELINEVQVYDQFSFITVPFAEAERILAIFQKKNTGKKPLVTKARKKES